METRVTYSLNRLRETWEVREETRRSMQSNRGTGTMPEEKLCQELRRLGATGYRRNLRSLPGTPDIAFTRARLAIFVHGCFWHGCRLCDSYRVPKTNEAFWREKVRRNQVRHQVTLEGLESRGYRTLTFWECQIKADIDTVARLIVAASRSQGKSPSSSERLMIPNAK